MLFAYLVSEMDNLTFYLIDDYVSTRPGEPFRLFPFGRIVKQGEEINLTPEMARRFKLPHFKPPIKLGSHKDETPAGGFIVALEVRPDGLYAIPEYTEQGQGAIERGDYRYNSPEVIWGDGFNDPTTGEPLPGPLIVGDALLHMPYLGEATALYSVEPFLEGDRTMADDNQDMVPLSLLERLKDIFGAASVEPAVLDTTDTEDQPPVVTVEQYTADIATRDETIAGLRERVDAMEAESAERQRRSHFAAELRETPYASDDEFITTLTALTDEQAAPIVERVRALSAQIDTGLTDEIGGRGHGSAVDAFEAAVSEYRQKHEVDYNTAVSALMRTEQGRDLYAGLNGGVA